MHAHQPLIFDLDGTLLDSAPDLNWVVNVLLRAHGRREVSLDELRGMVGHGAAVMLDRAFRATGEPLSQGAIDALYPGFLELYTPRVAVETRPYPGVPETLAALAERGHPMAVCTNKPIAPTKTVLAALGLSRFFAAVLGGDTQPYKKPDPRHVSDAVAAVGGEVGRAVMVGDSRADVDAARGAGMRLVVAVRYGYAHQPVDTLGADLVIDRFEELLGLLPAP